MLYKWHAIEADCELASANDGATIAMPPPSHAFKREAKNTSTMLSDINDVAVLLQERLLPLHRSRELNEVLILTAEEGRSNAISPWYRNTFGKVYISPDSTKRPDRTFANAVCKMQKRQAHTLSVDEKLAINKWLEKPAGNEVQSNLSLADRLSQLRGGEKRKADQMNNACDNDDNCFDHIIGSAAEVERLWSIARYILTTSRTKMAPIVFEAILFLRMNRALWDERTVMEALVAVRADQKDERLKKKLELANEQEENEEGGGKDSVGDDNEE
jgi:hypothetical protein